MPEAGRLEFPSFWNFEEVQRVRQEFNVQLTTFDQGALGHGRRKPTGVLSNYPRMTVLQGLTGTSAEPMEEELEARLKQSSRWASWAPGLVSVVCEAMKEHCEAWEKAGSSLGGAECPQVKGLTIEQWKQHIKRGHIPFNNKCRTCLKEMGVDLPHRRQKDGGTAFVMSADVVGPFIEGHDLGKRSEGPLRFGGYHPSAAGYRCLECRRGVGACARGSSGGSLVGSEGEAEAEPWILAGDDRGMADERVVRHVLDEAKALKEAELDLHGTLGVSTPRGCSCCSSGLESQDSSPWRSALRLHTDRAKEFLS